jgi:hypothetical protein
MAQLQEFKVVVTGKTFRVEGKVYNDDRQLVADFTGSNDVLFPQVMNDLTDQQVQELANRLGTWLLLHLAGLPSGA